MVPALNWTMTLASTSLVHGGQARTVVTHGWNATPGETGACCVDDACYDMTEEECEDKPGFWYGLGVDCADPIVECDPTPNRCVLHRRHYDIDIWSRLCRRLVWIGVDFHTPSSNVKRDDTGGDETGGDDTGATAAGDDTGATTPAHAVWMTNASKWLMKSAGRGRYVLRPGTDCDDDFVECCDESDTGHVGGDDGGAMATMAAMTKAEPQAERVPVQAVARPHQNSHAPLVRHFWWP